MLLGLFLVAVLIDCYKYLILGMSTRDRLMLTSLGVKLPGEPLMLPAPILSSRLRKTISRADEEFVIEPVRGSF